MRTALPMSLLVMSASVGATPRWTIQHESGASVMEELSTVSFRVTNTSTANEYLTELRLTVDGGDYDVDGGLAPAGWLVATVDRKEKTITFRPTTSSGCPRGLAPGAQLVFGLRLWGLAESADQTSEKFRTKAGRTDASFHCTGSVPSSSSVDLASSAGPTWKRVGLSARLAVSPRSGATGSAMTVTLSVTNRSTNTATVMPNGVNAIVDAVTGQTASPQAFTLSSSPSPNQLSLAPDATGTFTWTYQVNQQGVFRFANHARNATGTLTSPVHSSPDFSSGQFPGMVFLRPSRVVAGGIVQLSNAVTNNSSAAMLNVTPLPPSFLGTNTAAVLLSGPTPASAPSLAPGTTTSFQYSYRITGTQGGTFQFSAQATATQNGQPISNDPVGSATGELAAHTAELNPNVQRSTSTPVQVSYTVFNGGNLPIKGLNLLDFDSVFVPASQPWANDTSGWVGQSHTNRRWPISTTNSALYIAPGASRTFTFTFSSIGQVPVTTDYTHRLELIQTDDSTVRVEGGIAIFVPRVVPSPTSFTLVATNGQISLSWNNPSDHDGSLVLRSTSTPPWDANTVPVNGRAYAVGQTIGSASVVYADFQSYTSTFVDTNVTNGIRYHYKVFNKDGYHLYSSGDNPTTAGLFGEPSQSPGGPVWCYSVGLPTPQQPFTDFGVGVYTSSNARSYTGNSISATGQELWRPTPTAGVVQSRPTVTALTGHSGKHIVGGDQSGFVYAINAATGQVTWRGNGGASIGTVQAQAAVQLRAQSNTAFQTTFPNMDLVFFATRTASTSTNQVVALSSVDGSVVWAYDPRNLDSVSGGMAVDYANNRLWIASRSNGGTQPSLRCISTLTATLVPGCSFNLGDIDAAVVRNPVPLSATVRGQIAVVNTSGMAYGFDVDSFSQLWSVNVGGPVSGYLVSLGGGFLASTSTGVQRYNIVANDAGTPPFSAVPVWAVETPVSGASAARIDFTTSPYKLYVSDSAGAVHRLDLSTGTDEAQLSISTSGLGMPSIDTTTTPRRLFVGGLDGRLCAVNLPF